VEAGHLDPRSFDIGLFSLPPVSIRRRFQEARYYPQPLQRPSLQQPPLLLRRRLGFARSLSPFTTDGLADSTSDEGVHSLSFSPGLDGMDADQYSNALAAHDEDDEEDGSHFAHGLSAGAHHVHSQSDAANFAAHADFGRPELSIDPNLESHPPPEHHQDRQHQHQDDPHQRGHYGEQHMQRQLYNANQYTLDTPSEQPSEASPSQFPSTSPAPKSGQTSYTPTDRSLPDKHVTDETLDDAYVAFILYCNPSVPLDCDTAELRKAFRQPPKSDGKTFSTYHLLQLIEKFERKDIKTWTKLAIELGVERTPDSSAQKVQQYAVRLKVRRLLIAPCSRGDA
jgi:hypothetical protein